MKKISLLTMLIMGSLTFTQADEDLIKYSIPLTSAGNTNGNNTGVIVG